MSTINKTTLQRYNGTDWDNIYFATSADIVSMGAGFTASEETTGFKLNDVIEASDKVSDIITKLVNRLATLDTNIIPNLQSGNISSLDASKLTGTVARANLPADVGGKVVKVATEEAKAALTKTQVNIGDTVKVEGGAIYQVSGYGDDDAPTYEKLSDETSDVQWGRVKGTPTTVEGYGITDAVKTSDKAVAGGDAAAGKVATANAAGKLDFDVTGDAATVGGHAPEYFATQAALSTTNTNVQSNTDAIAAINESLDAFDASKVTKGQLPLSVIPKAALERIYVVADAAALATLTAEQVQAGDTVKIKDTTDGEGNVTVAGRMYLVSDATKLGTEDYMEGLVEYTAGTAAAVDWSGVNNKPTTLAGYGITDAVASSMVSDTAVAGKLLKLDADGKLPASITGDAATLETHPASYFATAAALTTLDTAYQATKTKVDELAAAVLGEGSDTGDKGTLIERMTAVETQIGAADTEGSILYSIAQLQAGTSIQALSATKITGKLTRAQLPDDVGGTVHAVADLATAYTTLNAENTHLGDWVKLADGKLYMATNTEALNAEDGYTLMLDVTSFDIAWAKITGKPTTLAGYGITDAVNVSDVIVDGLAEGADVGGKLVKINSTDKKMHVNIAGDAATVGGHAPDYFATKAALEALALQVPQMLNSVDELTNPKVGQMVMIPITAGTGD